MRVFNKELWPYQYRMLPEPDAWEQMCKLEAYCIDNLERDSWINDGLYFAFRRQPEATLFLLRWGG